MPLLLKLLSYGKLGYDFYKKYKWAFAEIIRFGKLMRQMKKDRKAIAEQSQRVDSLRTLLDAKRSAGEPISDELQEQFRNASYDLNSNFYPKS